MYYIVRCNNIVFGYTMGRCTDIHSNVALHIYNCIQIIALSFLVALIDNQTCVIYSNIYTDLITMNPDLVYAQLVTCFTLLVQVNLQYKPPLRTLYYRVSPVSLDILPW